MADPRVTIRFGTAGLNTVNRALSGMVTRFAGFALGVGGALTAALGARRLVRGLQDVIAEIDKVGESAQKTGVAVRELAQTNFVAALSKTSAEVYQKSLQKLARSIYDATNGTVTYKRAFEDAGIAIRNQDGTLKGTNQILLEMADVFQELPNGPQKTAIAMALMGRAGADMVPFLNQGADAIRELQQEAAALGQDVTPEMAQAAGDWNDNLTRLRFALRGVGNAIAKELLPFLVNLTNRLIAAIKENDRLGRFARWVAEGVEWFARAAIKAAFYLADLNGYMNVGVAIMVNLATVVWDVAKEVVRGFRDMTAAGEMFAEMLKALLSGDLGTAATYGRILERMVGLMVKRTVTVLADSTKEAIAAVEVSMAREAAAAAERQRLLGEILNAKGPTAAAAISNSAFDPAAAESAVERAQRLKSEMAEEANALSAERLAIATRLARIEHNRSLSETQQYRQSLEAKRDELALVKAYEESLRRRLAAEADINAQEQIRAAIERTRQDQARLGLDIERQVAEGDPASIRDQFHNAATDISRRIGTLAQQMARSFTDVMAGITEGLATSIEGLITRTMDWADALRNVARTMGGAVISAMSRMFAEWITKRLALMAKNIFAAQAEGAAETAAKTPGAVLTSISSWGVAAVVGLAAVMAALSAAGAFAAGGLVTGPGGPTDDQVLARLSAGEYVINAAAVDHYGRGALDALNARAITASDTIAGATAANAANGASGDNPGSKVAVFIVDDTRDIRKRLEADPSFSDVIVKTIRNRRIEIG